MNYVRSGRGTKPLARRTSIDERMDKFMERLDKIDRELAPAQTKRKLSKKKYEEFMEQYAQWKKSLSQLVRTEKRYLAPQRNEDDPKAKMTIGTYQSRISHYRQRIKGKREVNPLFYVEMKESLKRANNPDLLRYIFEDYQNKNAIEIDNQAYLRINEKRPELTDKDYESSLNLMRILFHPVLTYLRLTPREKDILAEQRSEAFNQSHSKDHIITIPIHKYLRWMERTLADYQNQDYISLTLALCLATGRRSIEILKLGEFLSPQKNSVIFRGQAKQKRAYARFNTQDTLEYRIPILYDQRICTKAMERIRELKKDDFDGCTNDQIHNRTASNLNLNLRKIFGHDFIEVRSLRSAYARICVTRFYQASKHGTEEAYLASILGHGSNDKLTVQHYKSVVFDTKDTPEKAKAYWDKFDSKLAKEEHKNEDNCNKIIEQLQKYDGQFRGAKMRIYKHCLEELKQGNSSITLTSLYKKGGFNYNAIKTFMKEVGDIFT